METKQLLMSTRRWGHWGWNTRTWWVKRNWYLLLPRFYKFVSLMFGSHLPPGWGILQCLREGHSCFEHLLWMSNCIWYWNITFQSYSFIVLDLKFSFTFSHSSFSEFERSKRMTWLDFISNLGGVCGLCLGISFISITELVYWFAFRFFKRILGSANWFEMLTKSNQHDIWFWVPFSLTEINVHTNKDLLILEVFAFFGSRLF